MAAKSDPNSKLIAENRRARFDYAIESDIEAGIILQGSEVKSLRQGGANIAESYASVEGGELWLINGYIAPYLQAKTWGHDGALPLVDVPLRNAFRLALCAIQSVKATCATGPIGMA